MKKEMKGVYLKGYGENIKKLSDWTKDRTGSYKVSFHFAVIFAN